MKPYILEETNWLQVKNTVYDVAVLPWGATEPHNYHLPYGTDSLETAQIARESAKKSWDSGAKVMVLPVIPLGAQNQGQVELPFCLHTSLSTQKKILKDIVKSLYTQGIRKLVLINGHGGNDFKPIIRELHIKFPGMLICLLEWFKLLDEKFYFEEKGDHAGEMETSIIMHYFPGLVLPLEKAGDGRARNFALKGLSDKTAWTPRRWNRVSEDTGIGYPKKATAEKGKIFLEEVTNRISAFLNELAKCNPDDIYESA